MASQVLVLSNRYICFKILEPLEFNKCIYLSHIGIDIIVARRAAQASFRIRGLWL